MEITPLIPIKHLIYLLKHKVEANETINGFFKDVKQHYIKK